ncbi:MAG: hypothetical protein U1F77_18640 [Kiritimatiellia bacterium]
MPDGTPVTMNGGTLNFSNNAGAASYAETAGALTIAANASTVTTAQAAASQGKPRSAHLRLAGPRHRGER